MLRWEISGLRLTVLTLDLRPQGTEGRLAKFGDPQWAMLYDGLNLLEVSPDLEPTTAQPATNLANAMALNAAGVKVMDGVLVDPRPESTQDADPCSAWAKWNQKP